MTIGIILMIIGVLGIIFTTIGLVVFAITKNKENEKKFITLQGAKGPKTYKLINRKTGTLELDKTEDIIDIEDSKIKKEEIFVYSEEIDDTVLL